MTILNNLPESHPLRNTKLGELKIEYANVRGGTWRTLFPSFGIAKVTFNELGKVWTDNDIFRVV